MISKQRNTQKRSLPVVGMTSLSLAVGAGSLELLQVAVAQHPAATQTTTTTAADEVELVRPDAIWSVPVPVSPDADSELEQNQKQDDLIQSSLQIPALPVAAPEKQWPPLPASPVKLPDTPELPTPIQLPRPVEQPTPSLPALPVVPALPTMPADPLPAPLPVAPIQLPPWPEATEPEPIRAHEAQTETAPQPRQHNPKPMNNQPVPKVVQPEPLAPLAPAAPLSEPVKSEILLPEVAPSFSVNAEPARTGAPGLPVSLPARSGEATLSNIVGEPPMIPSFTTVKSAVLGLAMASAPMAATQEPDSKIKPFDDAKTKSESATNADPAAELKASLQELRKKLDDERLERQTLADEVLGKKAANGKTEPGLIQKVSMLDERLQKIEDLLIKLEVRITELGNSKTITAQSPTLPGAGESATKTPIEMPKEKTLVGPKATLRLVNEYPIAISIIVNKKSYPLEPGETRVLEIAAGEYTYELVTTGSTAVTKTIKENDTMTLRIK